MMKKISQAMAALFLFGFSGYSQPVRHVLLVSIDGLRPEFYMDPSRPTPTLQALMKKGVYARGVRSVFPSLTYPSHTTMVTGALPARHGIYYNVPFGESKGHWYWEASYIKTKTLWDAIKEAGQTAGAVMWPVTVGAPIDYNFPVRRADNEEGAGQLALTLPYVTPTGLMEEMQNKATGPVGPHQFSEEEIDRTIGQMAAYILASKKPNLMAVHFIGVDHAEHVEGREGPRVRQALARVDSLVRSLWQTLQLTGLEASTTIIITGDHGFVNTQRSFSPNILLEKQGLYSKEVKLAQFHATGGSAFLYLENKNDGRTLQKVRAALEDLPGEEKALFRIIDREELDQVGANPEVALALAMSKGTVADNSSAGTLVKQKNKGGNHGYFPDLEEIQTGFIAFGAGIQAHHEIPSMGIKDIAPLIARLLQLNFAAPDGILVPGILQQNVSSK